MNGGTVRGVVEFRCLFKELSGGTGDMLIS